MSAALSPEDGTNPIVFFDVSLGGHELGRIKIELFHDKVPRTAENFRSALSHSSLARERSAHAANRTCRQFCTGEFKKNNVAVGYKGCAFHRVIKDFMCDLVSPSRSPSHPSLRIQGGDFVNGDGTGLASIYGGKFDDESFELKHDAAGLLSMANSGEHSNGCQFFITCAPADWLDNKHVVFGKVVDGMKVVRMIEATQVTAQTNKPKLPIVISQCGQM
jgi:peptidyl-prolyl isomerase H (cyclophilin H)